MRRGPSIPRTGWRPIVNGPRVGTDRVRASQAALLFAFESGRSDPLRFDSAPCRPLLPPLPLSRLAVPDGCAAPSAGRRVTGGETMRTDDPNPSGGGLDRLRAQVDRARRWL